VVDEDYLQYRVRANTYIGERLTAGGVPIVLPVGGHAVFIDAGAMLAHIPALQYPGQALAVALYEAGGIRSCEIGSVMFGRAAGRQREARGNGTGSTRHSAARVHAVACGLPDRGDLEWRAASSRLPG
jgi:tryptophanase